MRQPKPEHDHYVRDHIELGTPRYATRTKDGSLVVEWETAKAYEVRVYDKHGLRTRSDTAMDKDSSWRWALGAIEQHGGPKGENHK